MVKDTSLDKSIEQVVESGFIIQVSEGIKRIIDCSGT